MALLRVEQEGEITLPPEVCAALRLKEGDHLEIVLVENGVLLRPASGTDAKAEDELQDILSRPKWVGPGPEPSDDELMEIVVEEIHALRRKDDRSRSG